MRLLPEWLVWAETKRLIAAFGSETDKFRFVGGAVRDYLLEIKSKDVDLATSLSPEQVMAMLQKSDIRVIPTGLKHGTVTAVIGDKSFEITTLRRDTHCDGRHAEIEFTNDWREDAKRRDFTMNALYLTTEGQLFDYFNGAEDIKNGHVRFIGNARVRIAEDYLRILRFFRFFAYFGKGEPDESALTACSELSANIDSLSGERIQAEMLKLLAADDPSIALKLMRSHRILDHICGFSCKRIFTHGAGINDINVRLALLIMRADINATDALKILVERWKLPNNLRQTILALITHIPDISPAIDVNRQKQLIRRLGAETFSAVVHLKALMESVKDKDYISYNAMLKLAASWHPPVMPVTGNDLISAGIAPGQKLGAQLYKLEKIWEESNYKLSKEELLKYIE
jgi:poly(A) polymerase